MAKNKRSNLEQIDILEEMLETQPDPVAWESAQDSSVIMFYFSEDVRLEDTIKLDEEAVTHIFNHCPRLFSFFLETAHLFHFAINQEMFEKITFLLAAQGNPPFIPSLYFFQGAIIKGVPGAVSKLSFYEPFFCKNISDIEFALKHLPVEAKGLLAQHFLDAARAMIDERDLNTHIITPHQYLESFIPKTDEIDIKYRELNTRTIEMIRAEIDSLVENQKSQAPHK